MTEKNEKRWLHFYCCTVQIYQIIGHLARENMIELVDELPLLLELADLQRR